ncbi:ROK family protein [Rhodobacteraceae bacterium ASV31]|nr:ROK family protein [Anianabacter salinae]
MTPLGQDESAGCGPLIQSYAAQPRPLRQQVFERVRASGLIARSEVAKDLGVSPASVTSAASELIEKGLILEVDTPRRDGDGTRGRPPVALGVRPAAGHVAGLKLSDQSHSAIICDFAGTVIAEAHLRHGILQQDAAQVIEDALRTLDDALCRAGLERRDLLAVGLGLPGIVDSDTGVSMWSPLFRERGTPLGAILTERIGCPVRIDNDANCVTLAELWFGAGRTRPDFAVVTIEHGLGMGIVINHRLYRGALGLGLEFGHTKVQLDGALCRCGQRGCLEAYVADYALVREATTALNWGNRGVQSPQILLESLYDHAKAGNQSARAIFKRAGRYLALGLANIVNLFDPALILLSGERMRYDYLYAEEVLSAMRDMTLDTDRIGPRVEIRAWGDQVWARGAAALALEAATDIALAPETT